MASLPLGDVLADTFPARWPGPDPIHGCHVTLERLSQDHTSDLYAAIGSNEPLWTYVRSGPFTNLLEFAGYVQNFIELPDRASYAIVHKLSAKAVGHVVLEEGSLPNRVIEIGPVMYGAELQKSRAGTEVLYLVGKLVFEELGYRRWEWQSNSLNAASVRAAERYGFLYEGTWRKHMILKGRNRDTCIYSMIDENWPVCRDILERWLSDENFDANGKQMRSLDEVREQATKEKRL